MDDADLPDVDILDLWHLAAAAHAKHARCGEAGCRTRRANLEEADGLMDVWLSRHGAPVLANA